MPRGGGGRVTSTFRFLHPSFNRKSLSLGGKDKKHRLFNVLDACGPT